MRKLILAALATTVLVACGDDTADVVAAPEYTATQYNQAVLDIARTEADRESDGSRMPGELLAFAQIDKGEAVGDFIMGGGYVTRLLAMAVGADGTVYAFQPEEFIAYRPDYAGEQDAAVAPYSDDEGNPTRVFPLRASYTEPGFPEGGMDTIITVMNFHDLYTEQVAEGAADAAIASLFGALKPGGKLVVVDHSAKDGSGTDDTTALHRIGKQFTIDALTAGGFVLEEESDLYARADDPRDKNVFDESVRGKSAQFALRLVKPE